MIGDGWTGKVEVLQNEIRKLGDHTVVSLTCASVGEGHPLNVLIWLTENSMNIARAQLKAAGFNVDDTALDMLQQDRSYLQGNTFQASAEEYNNRISGRVVIQTVTKAHLLKLQEGLRRARRRGEPEPPMEQDSDPEYSHEDIPF